MRANTPHCHPDESQDPEPHRPALGTLDPDFRQDDGRGFKRRVSPETKKGADRSAPFLNLEPAEPYAASPVFFFSA